jgi:hypothetical protein
MYVVHWVPNDTRELKIMEMDTLDQAEGYRQGLLAAGVVLVSEVTMSA